MKEEKHLKEGEYLNAPSPYDEEGISLRDIARLVLKRKRLIAGIVVFSMVCAYAFCYVRGRSVTETLVKLDFVGMDKYEYPDGAQFDMNDLIAPDILAVSSKTIKNPAHLSAFNANPRGYVFVDAFTPEEINAKAKEMRTLEKKTLTYLPNQFFVRFIQPMNGPLSSDERKIFLQADIDEYRNKFLNGFVRRPLLALDVPETVLTENDYIDSYDILNSRVNNYIGFLDSRIEDAGHYRSPKTGKSFVDIRMQLVTMRDIDLNGVQSLIYSYRLSKQKGFLTTRTRFRIKEMERNREKKEAETTIARDLLRQVIEKEKQVIIPNIQVPNGVQPQITIDPSTLEKLSQKEYISMLIGRALDSGVQADSLRVDKKYLEDYLATLEKAPEAGEDTTAAKQAVEFQLARTKKDMLSLARDANDLNQEYLERKYSSILRVITPPYTYRVYPLNPKVAVFLAAVIGFIFSLLIAYIVETVSNTGKETV